MCHPKVGKKFDSFKCVDIGTVQFDINTEDYLGILNNDEESFTSVSWQ